MLFPGIRPPEVGANDRIRKIMEIENEIDVYYVRILGSLSDVEEAGSRGVTAGGFLAQIDRTKSIGGVSDACTRIARGLNGRSVQGVLEVFLHDFLDGFFEDGLAVAVLTLAQVPEDDDQRKFVVKVQAHLISPFDFRNDVAGNDGEAASIELDAGEVVGEVEALDAFFSQLPDERAVFQDE